MAGSISSKGHKRPSTQPRGSFWQRGEPFAPITTEMLTSDAWRSMRPASRCVFLDMLAGYWQASKSDTDPPRAGFGYTFSTCNARVSAPTFSAAISEIEDRGWFTRTRSCGPVPHFKPGPWRVYQAVCTLPQLQFTPHHGKAKPPKGSNAPLGHFRQPGQVFIPLGRDFLASEAWRSISPLGRCLALDMLRHFYAITNFDTVVSGFTFPRSACLADVSARSFGTLRAEIVQAGIFATPHDLQKEDGVIVFGPGDWRNFKPPVDGRAQIHDRSRETYLERQRKRRTAFLGKNRIGKNLGEGIGKNLGEANPDTTPTIGKNLGEAAPISA